MNVLSIKARQHTLPSPDGKPDFSAFPLRQIAGNSIIQWDLSLKKVGSIRCYQAAAQLLNPGHFAQGILYPAATKRVIPSLQTRRNRPGTRQQRRLRHFAKNQVQHPGRHRQHCRTMQRAGERPREYSIRDRLRCGRINGSRKPAIPQRQLHHSDQIGKRDPAHPLAPVSQPSAQSEAKDRPQLRQRPAFRRQHHPRPQPDHPRAPRFRDTRLFFPSGTDLGEEPCSATAGFIEDLFPAVTIKTDRTCVHPDPRRLSLLSQINHQSARKCNATFPDGLFSCIRPTPRGEVFARQMHDCIHRHPFRKPCPACAPLDFPGHPGCVSHEPEDGPSASFQFRHQRAAHEARRTRD